MLSSFGLITPSTSRIISTSHHIPNPPKVINFPIATPDWPKQNRSTANTPKNIEYKTVEIKYLFVYLNETNRD